MPQGKTPKMHGSIANVPVNVGETCDHLPQKKTKKKIIFSRTYLFSASTSTKS